MEVVRLVVEGVAALISLAERLGHRDAVLAALDATYAAAKQRTDADLAAKHAACRRASPLFRRPPACCHGQRHGTGRRARRLRAQAAHAACCSTR